MVEKWKIWLQGNMHRDVSPDAFVCFPSIPAAFKQDKSCGVIQGTNCSLSQICASAACLGCLMYPNEGRAGPPDPATQTVPNPFASFLLRDLTKTHAANFCLQSPYLHINGTYAGMWSKSTTESQQRASGKTQVSDTNSGTFCQHSRQLETEPGKQTELCGSNRFSTTLSDISLALLEAAYPRDSPSDFTIA
eukprot:1158933-Pelagomonas_calceolata.AAC.9